MSQDPSGEAAQGKGKCCTMQLLGQHVPINWAMCVIVAIIVIPVCFLIFKLKDPDTFFSSIVAGHFASEGKNSDTYEAVVYSFWTPSLSTLQSATEYKTAIPEERKKFYVLDAGEETLIEFGKALKQAGAQGFTRVESVGEGSVGLKRGWTWWVTASKSSSFSVTTLTDLYSQYFHRKDKIYVEIYGLGKTRFEVR